MLENKKTELPQMDVLNATTHFNHPLLQAKNRHLFANPSLTLEAKMKLVREIWLAGLGAYSNSVNGVIVSGEKSSIYFENLLSRGKEVEHTFSLATHEKYISLNGLEKLIDNPNTLLRHQKKHQISLLQERVDALLKKLKQVQAK